ncbi:hypothetical protein DMUE_5054 [Dictyocoela muelleri]|nr:hypothetical protein DMUE_5054 [Dictyocoela muelleri]
MAQNILVTLKRKRSARKGVITRILNDFNTLASPSKLQIENILSSMNRYKQEIIILDEEIISEHDNLSDLDDQQYADLLVSNDDYINDVNLNILNVQNKYEEIIKLKEQELNSNLVEAMKDCSVQNLSIHDNESRPKLPTLEIPIFDGDKTKFQPFLDKFNSAIGNKSSVANVDKFCYLLKYLKGGALKLVEALPVVDSTYETALQILNKTYLNLDEIKYELALKLINLKLCKDNYEDLFNFYCELECLLGQISNYKLNIEESSWLIETIVFSRIPLTVREMFQNKINKTYPNLESIRENFPTILSLYKSTKTSTPPKYNNSDNTRSNYVHNNKQTRSNVEIKPERPHASLQSFNNNVTVSASNFKCKFCSSVEHNSSSCDKYSNYEARVKRCDQLKLCQKCTGENHNKKECKTKLKYKYRECSDDHVVSMCPGENENKNENKSENKNKKSKTFNSKVTNGHISLNGTVTTNPILLPTMTLQIKNDQNNLVDVRAYIDTCSQQTFINRSLLHKLNIPYETKSETINISSFARKDSDNFKSISANISVKIGKVETILNTLAIDKVCNDSIKIPGLKEVINNLESTYAIADKSLNSDDVDNVDVLIGADYIHLVHEGVVKIGDGIALKTPVGISLMGDITKYKVNNE